MALKEIIPFVFLDIAIVVVAARLMGKLFHRLRQPAVVGEIVAGIVLGPTLLGLLPGDLDKVLFPMDARPYLTVIAQVGLVLFMFIVGLEVDLSLIRSHRRTATAVSLTSIALPFGLGVVLAGWLYSAHSTVDGRQVPPLAFGLFLGAAMSITAFPVLARILTERRMHRIPTGVLALACAAIDDVVAWSLLAVVIAVAVGGTFGGVGLILGMTVLYAAVMFLVVRPLLARLVDRYRAAGRLTPDILAVVLAGLLLSAYVTELIGVHAIFGAFVFGAVMPRTEPALTRAVLERLEQVALLLLLPVFFVVAGLQVDVGAIGLRGLGELGLILAVAIGGKFLGAAAAARLQRVPQRQAAALGVLMNTRGLTEIVILQVGAQLGVLDQNLFTLMVLMALITTIMTEPLLRRIYADRVVNRDIAAVERAELGQVDAFTVLVVLPPGTPADEAGRLVGVARRLVGHQRPAQLVLCRLLPGHGNPLELASGVGADLSAIAAAGDELRRLAADAQSEGVRASVVVRFSADPAADVGALAANLDVDVVLVEQPDPADLAAADGARPGTATAAQAALPEVGAAALVTARLAVAPEGPGPARVGVLVDGGAGGRAALRLGGQMALHQGKPLLVGGLDERRSGRRVASAVAALARLGIPAAELDGSTRAGLLLVPDGAEMPPTDLGGAASTVLTVRPAASDGDDDLQQALGRITTAAG